eukprot:GHVT01062017.1.p1 GENE.GHVT01062017.1~~GHVT01062017.1.p1  ORF type:complete len:275 (+),score=34.83 GHVT01062017.1:47-871(+)
MRCFHSKIICQTASLFSNLHVLMFDSFKFSSVVSLSSIPISSGSNVTKLGYGVFAVLLLGSLLPLSIAACMSLTPLPPIESTLVLIPPPIESTSPPPSAPIVSTLPPPSAPVPSPLPIGPSLPPSPSLSPSPLFGALDEIIRSCNWLGRDLEAIHLVDHGGIMLSSDKIDSKMLQEQVKNKEKVVYFFLDSPAEYSPEWERLNGVLSRYNFRNPTMVDAKYMGPKTMGIPLLPEKPPNPLADLDTIKKLLLKYQLPFITNHIKEGYKFVVVGLQ